MLHFKDSTRINTLTLDIYHMELRQQTSHQRLEEEEIEEEEEEEVEQKLARKRTIYRMR